MDYILVGQGTFTFIWLVQGRECDLPLHFLENGHVSNINIQLAKSAK